MTETKSIDQRKEEYAARRKALQDETNTKNEMLKAGRKFCHDNEVKIYQCSVWGAQIDFGVLVNPKEILNVCDGYEGIDLFIFGFCCPSPKDSYSLRTSRGLIGYRLQEYLKNFTSTDETRLWVEDNVIETEVRTKYSKTFLFDSTKENYETTQALCKLFLNRLVREILMDSENIKLSEKTKKAILHDSLI